MNQKCVIECAISGQIEIYIKWIRLEAILSYTVVMIKIKHASTNYNSLKNGYPAQPRIIFLILFVSDDIEEYSYRNSIIQKWITICRCKDDILI